MTTAELCEYAHEHNVVIRIEEAITKGEIQITAYKRRCDGHWLASRFMCDLRDELYAKQAELVIDTRIREAVSRIEKMERDQMGDDNA